MKLEKEVLTELKERLNKIQEMYASVSEKAIEVCELKKNDSQFVKDMNELKNWCESIMSHCESEIEKVERADAFDQLWMPRSFEMVESYSLDAAEKITELISNVNSIADINFPSELQHLWISGKESNILSTCGVGIQLNSMGLAEDIKNEELRQMFLDRMNDPLSATLVLSDITHRYEEVSKIVKDLIADKRFNAPEIAEEALSRNEVEYDRILNPDEIKVEEKHEPEIKPQADRTEEPDIARQLINEDVRRNEEKRRDDRDELDELRARLYTDSVQELSADIITASELKSAGEPEAEKVEEEFRIRKDESEEEYERGM